MPKMRYPDGGLQVEVAPGSVTNYESQGWQKVAAKKSAPKKTPAAAAADQK